LAVFQKPRLRPRIAHGIGHGRQCRRERARILPQSGPVFGRTCRSLTDAHGPSGRAAAVTRGWTTKAQSHAMHPSLEFRPVHFLCAAPMTTGRTLTTFSSTISSRESFDGSVLSVPPSPCAGVIPYDRKVLLLASLASLTFLAARYLTRGEKTAANRSGRPSTRTRCG
jgi:hypothetical protein